MAADADLAVRGVSAERAGRRVLIDVDLRAQAGEIVAVLGPNGAGKSSLLRAIAGLQPYRGAIEVGGQSLHALPARERAKSVAFVPQQSALRAALPVHEVVEQGRYPHRSGLRPGVRDRAAVRDALAITGCTELTQRAFTQLSLGEQRRVLIARALCSEARVLCLDEPTAAFDVGHALRLYALLRQLARGGRAVVVVLHQLDDALHHADRALLLAGGRVEQSGAVRDVISEDPVRRVYGVELRHGAGLGFRLPEGPA